jgi:ribonuclease HI
MFGFLVTNNVAEYEAVIAGLGLAEALKAYPLQVHSDS